MCVYACVSRSSIASFLSQTVKSVSSEITDPRNAERFPIYTMKIILYHEGNVGLNKLRFMEHLGLGITCGKYPFLVTVFTAVSPVKFILKQKPKKIFFSVFSQCRIID